LVAFVLSQVHGQVASAAGTTGRWSLIDTARYPGATCYFGSTTDDSLHRISVRAPVMFAFDATSSVNRQKVGWRWVIQHYDGVSMTWQVDKKGPTVLAMASDQYNAQWPSLTGTYNRGSAPLYGGYRAIVVMSWYGPRGGIQGSQRAIVAHYVDHYNGADHGANTYCADTLG